MIEKMCGGKREKRIKVIYKVRTNNRKSIWDSLREEMIPKIQMEGKWLEAIGFRVGDPLIVEYDEGYIKISHAEAENKQEPLMVAESMGVYRVAGNGTRNTNGGKRKMSTTKKR